VVKLLLWQ